MESNHRHGALQAPALPLSYPGTKRENEYTMYGTCLSYFVKHLYTKIANQKVVCYPDHELDYSLYREIWVTNDAYRTN